MMRPMRRLRIGGLAAALSVLSGSAVAAPQPLDAPPPASLENHDVEAWAEAYLHTDGRTLLPHNLEGAHLPSLRGAVMPHDGVVELEIRTELFHAVTVGAGPARSGVAR